MGKHEYKGRMAIDEDHLCYGGSILLTSRLNDLFVSLEGKE